MGNSVPVVTVDGPSGAGKGTLTQMLARHLGWHLLDSGALYRLVALQAQRDAVATDDTAALVAIAQALDVRFLPSVGDEPTQVELRGDNVTQAIRTETCGEWASKIAPQQAVRDALLQRQRDFLTAPGLVADGRDMGTVVFPEAPCKIYLTASAEERARRRFEQLKAAGHGVKISALLSDIQARDARDMGRKNAPLKPADDAQVVDTTGLSITDVFALVLQAVERSLSI